MNTLEKCLVSALAALSLSFPGCKYVGNEGAAPQKIVYLGEGYACAGDELNVRLYKDGKLVAGKKARIMFSKRQDLQKKLLQCEDLLEYTNFFEEEFWDENAER